MATCNTKACFSIVIQSFSNNSNADNLSMQYVFIQHDQMVLSDGIR